MRFILGVFVLLTIIAVILLTTAAEKVFAIDDPNAGKLNLNTASVSELTILPGIGEVKAKAIVEYRTAHNGFKSIEEIMEVKGIGEKTFIKLKDLIYVEPQKKMAVVSKAFLLTTWGNLKASR